jgi:hypothetical protein
MLFVLGSSAELAECSARAQGQEQAAPLPRVNRTVDADLDLVRRASS